MFGPGLLATIVAITLSGGQSDEQINISCDHFSMGGKRTGLVPGQDLGVDSARYGSGYYECKVNLTDADVLNGKYVYVGEVGDASYIEFVSGPRGGLQRPIITHGLAPSLTVKPRYLRFLPLTFSVRDLYDSPGKHVFRIYYRDLVPKQTGLRSGLPTVEGLSGVVKRAIWNSPGLTYHLLQAILLLFGFLGVALFWQRVPIRARLLFSLSFLGAAATITSITAIPRYLIDDPILIVRLNDSINIATFALIGHVFNLYLRPVSPQLVLLLRILRTVAPSTFILLLLATHPDSSIYLPLYSFGLFFAGGLYPLISGLSLIRRTAHLSVSAMSITWPGLILVMCGVMMTWDTLVNIMIFDIRWYFLVHYFYFVPMLVTATAIKSLKDHSASDFHTQLALLKELCVKDIISDNGAFTLNGLCTSLAGLFNASRISILELVGTSHKFLGFFGAFDVPSGLQDLDLNSPLAECTTAGKITVGKSMRRSLLKGSPAVQTEYVLIPLFSGGRIKGALCVTDFQMGTLLPFLKERLASVAKELEILLSLLLSERQNRSKATLLEMTRIRSNKLQITSEEYFLDNFRVSQTQAFPAFLMGDLVDSTPLRSQYGDKVRTAIDQQLDYIFEKFKHLGITLSREKGDFVSVSVPNQYSDPNPSAAARRAYEIATFLANPDEAFKSIPKDQGIRSPFLFNFVCSSVDTPIDFDFAGGLLPSFTQLSNSAIDSASRVLDNVCRGGEVLVLGTVVEALDSGDALFCLPPRRLKGVPPGLEIYAFKSAISMTG